MPSRENRARRRRRGAGVLPALIVLLAVVAAALTFLLVRSDPLGREENQLPFEYTQSPDFAQQGGSTAAPLVLGGSAATATPEPSTDPTPTPAPDDTSGTEPAPEDDVAPQESDAPETESARLTPTVQPGDYFLPVFNRALRTLNDEAMIAVTIDDCNDPEALTQVLAIAKRYDAKLTLFPTGEALMTQGMTEGFRTCVRNLGYELENHSFSHKAEYKLSSGELAIQIWKQSIAASYAMGRDYQQHFYRPYSNYSVSDQRTHFYIRKLGYLGVAGYTHSYRDCADAAALLETLENGKIYQFDMSEKSMGMLEEFVEGASRKGYKLVTMNRLFDLDENELGPQLTIDQQTLPPLDDYTPTYYNLKLNDRVNAVYALQSRLMSLGYLTGEGVKADGIYGPSTSIAVSAFQANVGLPATGNADVATQERLFASDAPLPQSAKGQ